MLLYKNGVSVEVTIAAFFPFLMDVDFGLFGSYNPSAALGTSVGSSGNKTRSMNGDTQCATKLNVWRERVRNMTEAALSSVMYKGDMDQEILFRQQEPLPHTLSIRTGDSDRMSVKYRSLSEARLSRRCTPDKDVSGPCPKRRADTVGARLRQRQLEELRTAIVKHKSELALIEEEIQRYTNSLDLRC
jgi:hypothetical protein